LSRTTGFPLTYVPRPINIDHVHLPGDVVELTELLAKNTHEHWAAQRMADGWRYGARRDDAAKTHPCLVPYEALPDAEKQYDRLTAISTLKTILALGYSLAKSA
jgi:hypothetical protein